MALDVEHPRGSSELENDIYGFSKEQLRDALVKELAAHNLDVQSADLDVFPKRFGGVLWSASRHYGLLLKLARTKETITPDELVKYIRPGQISPDRIPYLKKYIPEPLRARIVAHGGAQWKPKYW